MTLPVPLGVRLKTSRGTKHVTRELRSLTFRTVAPGGYASAAFALDRPLTVDPDEIAYYGNVYIDDLRNGQIVWEGRLEDPGRSAGVDGQVWDLAAVGPSAHAQDKVVPRIYVDGSTERWLRSGYTDIREGRADPVDSDADPENPAIDLIFPEGVSLSATKTVDVMYRTIYDCGQALGRVRVIVKNGSTNANRNNRIMTRTTPSAAGTTRDSATWNTTEATLAASRGGSNDIPSGDKVANVRISHDTGTVTAGATAWGEFRGFVVRSVLKDINGSDLSNVYTLNTVLASEVITDLIGRGDLGMYDPATASIATTSFAIDQLAFPSGVTPAEILDRLMEIEPAYYWRATKSQTNGKYKFEWLAWPTTVRYEADVKDGYTAPGSADGLFNEALVSYRDWRGRERTATRTSTVADLTNAGLTRTILVDLADETNSLANANQAGDQALTEHASPPNAGSLTIAREVYDLTLGRKVKPWEILPGYLIRTRGIRPNLDSLNATARDGATVFKIASNTYSADTATAVLELDSFAPSVARALAALAKRRQRRR